MHLLEVVYMSVWQCGGIRIGLRVGGEGTTLLSWITVATDYKHLPSIKLLVLSLLRLRWNLTFLYAIRVISMCRLIYLNFFPCDSSTCQPAPAARYHNLELSHPPRFPSHQLLSSSQPFTILISLGSHTTSFIFSKLSASVCIWVRCTWYIEDLFIPCTVKV